MKNNKIKGEYRDSKKNGQGVYTWHNGDKHVGEYKNGKWHEQSIFTYDNGNEE
jgi:hypothetical protein